MTNTNKVLLGIVGAAAAGVVIGLLIAPDRGKETRKLIGKTTGKWVDSMGRMFTRKLEENKHKKMKVPVI